MSETNPNWTIGVTEVSVTDVGMRRSQNQDACTVMLSNNAGQWERRGHLFMVADGMGAHAAGELASKLAVDYVPDLYARYAKDSPPEGLQRAITEANAEIHNRGKANADFHQMGTTASCLVLLPQGALIGHVGDSRIYRFRDHVLHQLTFDHSLVWEMRAANQIPDGEGHAIPKNVITRSLGPNPSVQVDVEGPIAVEQGDVFLICSDGLTGPVPDKEIAAILACMSPADAAESLVHLANLRGGPDNSTVVVVRADEEHVCTSHAGAAPLSIGRHAAPPTPPVLWVAPIVCVLVSLVLFLASQKVLAATLLAAGLASLAFIGLQRFRGSRGIQLDAQRRLGKGPYAEESAPAEPLATVDAILGALHDRADQLGWQLNWASVENHRNNARSGGPQAPHELTLAFRCLMIELKSFLASQASDSAVEL